MKIKEYWLSPKISWKTYKLLNDKTSIPNSGPVAKNLDKILYKLLKERKINIYITSEPIDGDVWFPTIKKIPKGATLLTNGLK